MNFPETFTLAPYTIKPDWHEIAFSRSESVTSAIFVNNFDGYIIGHINPKLVGKTLLGLRDVKGNAFAAELQKIAKSKEGKGWSEYWWPRPDSDVAEQKVSYILRVPGKKIFVGTGIYGMGKEDIERVLKKQKPE